MSFTSYDNIVSALTSGQGWRMDWNKITGASAYTAGRWYDFSLLNGTPVANAYSGTALAYQSTTDTSGFGLWHGGNVSPAVKSLFNQYALTAVATGVPGTLMLVDMQGYWPGINMNLNTAQTLTGTPSSTYRYTNGAGLRLFLVPTVATGATAHNVAISYTNQAGTSARALPVTVACTASAIVGHITHSGTAANNYGPFLPLASTDYGVQNVASLTLSAASLAGTASLVLCKPLAQIQVVATSVGGERDHLNQFPSLPVINDGACLTFLYFAGAATAASTNFYGATEFAWN